ncbi:alcohol dehydrogenase catalytic domain-containing protein [Aeromicrobium sp. UC242_57]|uniref:alcohol dehydrogenase catalytic domain-containing protein n=1 Tax=Aeromicrobium sp. UC242_57 TaxID=3374624 RepID=UPI00378839E2
MLAFIVEKYAKTGAVRAVERPEPTVAPHDVLVRVEAAGANPLDSKIAQGEFKLILPYKPPFVLGHDLAGVVIRIGSAVTRFAVGDVVFGRPTDFRIGTFAEPSRSTSTTSPSPPRRRRRQKPRRSRSSP